MCILDLCKTLMNDFHDNYIKRKYRSKAKLWFTDTDSLTYEIETNDVYKDKFDNSDYPEDSKFHDKTTKKSSANLKMKLLVFQ